MKEKHWSVFVSVLFLAAFVTISYANQSNSALEADSDNGGSGNTDILGPTADIMSDQGELFGDLYVILRYQGGEEKKVPAVGEDGKPIWEYVNYTAPDGTQLTVKKQAWTTAPAVGGEPVLTEDFVFYVVMDEDTGQPVPDPETGSIWYISPYPSQCVRPVASYERWGDISARTGLDRNRIPLVMIYDPTWDRTECEVGELIITDPVDGIVKVNPWFIATGGTWNDPVNGMVSYPDGVLWTDLVQEVSFGRMNVGRSPEAVLNAAFDEAVSAINSAIAIELDAAGRLLLTKNIYSEFEVDTETGEPQLLGTVKKAIDSPLENLALYVKLLSDGHLVTPGDERAPLDRSELGGIPLSRMLELTDGPSDALRPSIDIDKLEYWGLGHLVDVQAETYYTYFEVEYDFPDPVTCIPVSRTLVATANCPETTDSCGQPVLCQGPFTGISSDDGGSAGGDDFKLAASFFAAAADKTGNVSVDMLMYLNSILGLNKVSGYSAYDEEGKPLPDAINYADHPIYYNFAAISGYDRDSTYRNRGEVNGTDDGGAVPIYTGSVLVLQPENGGWFARDTPILGETRPKNVIWNEVIVGWDEATLLPEYALGTDDILGFTQMADDNLNVIEFIHTYQIPERR